MIQNNPTSVVAAFEMLLEEIEAEIDLASRVQWARKSMVKERLLRNDSPRGVWQISEAAKRFLRNGGHG